MLIESSNISISIEVGGVFTEGIAPPPSIPDLMIPEVGGPLDFLVSENGIDRLITQF